MQRCTGAGTSSNALMGGHLPRLQWAAVEVLRRAPAGWVVGIIVAIFLRWGIIHFITTKGLHAAGPDVADWAHGGLF
jgi:NhaP-type Na+/H+ or K+/H+ antiporter